MGETISSVLLILLLTGGVAGLIYWLIQRGKKKPAPVPDLPEPGPIAKKLLLGASLLAVLIFLSIIGALVLRSRPLVWLTVIWFVLYVLDGMIYRAIRSSGL